MGSKTARVTGVASHRALVVTCLLMCALDGFDLLSISFALPGIRADWGVGSAALGLAISAGLVGTGLGSLFIAPLSDRFGRRPVILTCLAAMAAGMLGCGVCAGLYGLAVGRLLTGIGIGGVLPPVSALTAETTVTGSPSSAVALMATGFPAGGLIGGGIAAVLLAGHGWRSVFLFGSVATALMALLSARYVPESLPRAVRRDPASAGGRLSGSPEIAMQGAGGPGATRLRSLLDVLRPSMLPMTALVTASYALHNVTFYYALNWLPKIGVDLGLTLAQAAAVAAWCSGGGVIGSLCVAWLAKRFEIRLLTMASVCGAAALVALLGRGHPSLTLFTMLGMLMGSFLYAGQVGLYALMMKSFPTHVRATGAGFVTGVGRLGGILSPTASGLLFAAGLNNGAVSLLMALGSVAAVFALWQLGPFLLSGTRIGATAVESG